GCKDQGKKLDPARWKTIKLLIRKVEHQPAWKAKSRQRPSCRGMKEVAF
ncbi:hypothetical protein Tco_0949852, partial [Tanacetum coccineum]